MSKKVTEEQFNRVHQLRKDKLKYKYIAELVGLAQSTCSEIARFETMKEYNAYNNARLAGAKARKEQAKLNIEDKAIAEINKQDGYTLAIEELIMATQQILASQKTVIELLEFVHKDLIRVINDREAK